MQRASGVRAPFLAATLIAASFLLLVTRAAAAPSVESAASSFEKQAERIEAELAETPGDEGLIANLTRTRVDAANALISDGGGESKSGVEEVRQQLFLAAEDWSEYLKVAKKPSPGLAIEVAPAYFRMAELSSTGQEALENVKGATEAQEIVTGSRPGLSSWSTLAFYALFAQDFELAEESKEEATRYASTNRKRESFEDRYEEVEKSAKRFGKRLRIEKGSKSKSAGKESRGNSIEGLGGTGGQTLRAAGVARAADADPTRPSHRQRNPR